MAASFIYQAVLENDGRWRKPCQISLWIFQIGTCANICLICAISIERAYTIFYPLKARIKITTWRMRIVSAIIWKIILISQTYVIYCFGDIDNAKVCGTVRILRKEVYSTIYKMPFHILSSVTACAYIAVGIHLYRKTKKKRKKLEYANQKDALIRKQKKTTKMLLVSGGAFYLLYLIPHLCHTIDIDPDIDLYVHHISQIIFAFNFTINPIIYWHHPDFQDAYRAFLNMKKRTRKTWFQASIMSNPSNSVRTLGSMHHRRTNRESSPLSNGNVIQNGLSGKLPNGLSLENRGIGSTEYIPSNAPMKYTVERTTNCMSLVNESLAKEMSPSSADKVHQNEGHDMDYVTHL